MNGTDQVIDAVVGSLNERALMARRAVERGAEGLSVEGIATALEGIVDVLDMVGAIVMLVNARTETIREREVTERREGSALEALDQALVHLSYGKEVLEGGRHLLGAGWGEVLRVTRSEV